jgi:hypothetical protein
MMEASEQAENSSEGTHAPSEEIQRRAEKDGAEASKSRSRSVSSETARPPLPPRQKNTGAQDEVVPSSAGSPRLARLSSKQNLQSKATTALSVAEISTQIFPDGSREIHSSTPEKASAFQDAIPKASFSRMASRRGSDAGDTASIRSFRPNTATGAGDLESIFGDFPGMSQDRAGWNSAFIDNFDSFDLAEFQDEDTDFDFSDEFESIGELDPDGHNEGMLAIWMLISSPLQIC